MTDFDISCLAGKGLDRLVLCGDDRQLGINTVASRSRPYNSPLDAALNERLRFDRSAFYRLRKVKCPSTLIKVCIIFVTRIRFQVTWRMSARLFSFTNKSYDNRVVSQVPAGQPSSVFEMAKQSPVHFIQIATKTKTKCASIDTSPSSAEEVSSRRVDHSHKHIFRANTPLASPLVLCTDQRSLPRTSCCSLRTKGKGAL